ncbi:hypothetical protein [Leifsonia aquatica]|uniref:hypothetical protein n=1 Tax=Leifsonia aquatica TaxID=144185 RepID=UPI003804C80D
MEVEISGRVESVVILAVVQGWRVADLGLEERWRRRETPDVEGVVFRSGELHLMEFSMPSGPMWFPRLSARDWEPVGWIDFDTELVTERIRDWVVRGGESSAHGSIGWLSAAHADELDQPAWVLTSGYSNPFIRIRSDHGFFEAFTTSGFIWRVRLEDPLDLTIRFANETA